MFCGYKRERYRLHSVSDPEERREGLSVRGQNHSNTFRQSKMCFYTKGETFVFKEVLTTDRLKKELIKQSEDILTICCLSGLKLHKDWILQFP